jgi:crossover junction endodeoxyribonuclease RusA
MGGNTREITIELAWPSPKLSPNARVHWAEKSRFTKASKDTAYWITKAALGAKFGPTFKFQHGGEDIPVRLLAHPIKGKARPDADNLIASCKAFLDGIALGLSVDDKHFRPTLEWADPAPNGKLFFEVALAVPTKEIQE